MIRIISTEAEPIHQTWYERPRRGGGSERDCFRVHRSQATGIPEALSAILVMSDLQGFELPQDRKNPRLLSEVVAEELGTLAELGELSPVATTGVLLAGDLYSNPLKRGGTGDVRHCWRAFREAGFRWICGVAGNHDSFGDGHEFQEFLSQRDICFLDGRVVELDGLKIAGISGVMGNPRRLFRRKSEVFLRTIEEVVAKRPDVLVLHEGPSAEPESTFPGQKVIRQTLETLPPTFVLFGHSHWESAEARSLANGTQVINIDARAHLLVPSNRSVRRHDR